MEESEIKNNGSDSIGRAKCQSLFLCNANVTATNFI